LGFFLEATTMKTKLILMAMTLVLCAGIADSQQISGTQTRDGFDYSIKISADDLRDTPHFV
jgi:hypothetical protein